MSFPVLQNLSVTFLFSAETGIIMQNFGRNTSCEMIWVYDGSVGNDIGFVGHNPEATYDIGGFISGNSGIAAAAPASALTIANTDYGNGVGTTAMNNGTIWTLTTALTHAVKQIREFKVTAIQKPGITSS